MSYRPVPWKRNLSKIPESVRSSLNNIKTDLIVVGSTRLLTPHDMSEAFRHLAFPIDLAASVDTLPQQAMGKYSTRNVDGWEVVRRDLPMITKTYYWETPNFGDASTYGTHSHYQDREVYQREFHEPRGYRISVSKLKEASAPNGPAAYRFTLDHQLDQSSPLYDSELLFMLNLLQENTGAVGVYASDASREDYLGTLHLDWEVFPPGTQAELVKLLTPSRHSAAEVTTIAARVAMFSRLKPRAFLKGSGSLNSYVGAQFADDLVVFENVRYGNALYILYDNWEDISHRSRLDLLKGTDARFDRIVHKPGWEDTFDLIMDREKRLRRLR
jgi:hypothetical protein